MADELEYGPEKAKRRDVKRSEPEAAPVHERNADEIVRAGASDPDSLARTLHGADPTTRASAVERMHSHAGNATVQRLVADIQREEMPEEDELMMKREEPAVGLEGGSLDTELSSRVQAERGGGSALDGSTRETMEDSLGADFSDVRVHTDAESHDLNRSMSAQAFTTGSDIFFSQGSYSPGTTGGDELLAHELTHVVQQDGAPTGGPLTVGPAGDHHEHEADSVAGALRSAPAASDLQRMEDDEMAAGIQRQAMEEEEEELLE